MDKPDSEKRIVKSSEKAREEKTTKRSSRQGFQHGSVTSAASSAKMKTEMKKAALKAKIAALKEKIASEKEKAEWQTEQMKREADIKARKLMHELQTAIAEADAKMEVLQKYEISQTHKNVTKVSDIKIASHVYGHHHINAEDTLQSQLPQRTSPASNEESNNGPEFDNLSKAITQQVNVSEYLVKNLKASLLPHIIIPTFSGDPLEYKNFIRAFEHAVEDRTDNDRDRLYFLQQYTSGQLRELLGSCNHMEPSAGYAKAKRMLKEYYGDDFKIADAYINKALGWDKIQPEDGAALQSFGLFLTNCCNTMADISYMEDLNNTTNIRELANKLPYTLKERWREVACDLHECTNKRATFKDFVEFVNKEVKYILHPLYGNLKDSTRLKEQREAEVRLQFKEKGGTKKVFATAAVPKEMETGKWKENKVVVMKQKTPKAQTFSGDANSMPCVYCKGEQHCLAECRKLKIKPHKERIDFLRTKGLCFGCLKHGHMSSSCKERSRCQECFWSHPTLLHMKIKVNSAQDMDKTTTKESCGMQTVSSAFVETESFGVTEARTVPSSSLSPPLSPGLMPLELPASSRSGKCTVCFNREVDTVIYTCGHMCLCNDCGLKLKRQINACCPICRRPIKDVIKTYRP